MPPNPTTAPSSFQPQPAMPAAAGIDPWYEQRGVPSQRPERPAPWMMGAGLVLALVLLGWFYAVLNQAVARAHTHWATAPTVNFAAQDCGSAEPVPSSACLRVDTATAHGLTTAFLTPAR